MTAPRTIDTQLRMAISAGKKALVIEALDSGANVQACAADGSAPLALAVLSGQFDIADVLLSRGAKIDARDNARWTALMHAAYVGHEAAVRYLVERGADTEWEDENQQTALTLAQWGGADHVVAVLVHAADIRCSWLADSARRDEAAIHSRAEQALARLKAARPQHDPFRRKKGGPGHGL